MSDQTPLDLSRIQSCVALASQIASSMNHEYVTIEHLLGAALSDEEVTQVMMGLNVDPNAVANDLEKFLLSPTNPTVPSGIPPRRIRALDNVIQRAAGQAMFSGRSEIVPVDLLVSILQEGNSNSAYFLDKNGLDLQALKAFLSHGPEGEEGDEDTATAPAAGGKGATGKNTKLTPEKAKAVLEKFTTNLNEKAGQGGIDPLIGRENEVYTLVKTTARRSKNNVVLVGEPGVGKTAIAEGLAKLIVEDKVPEILKGSTVYSLDVGAIMAGTKFRGDMEERIKLVIEAMLMQKRPIMFIDEIHMIMGAGAGSGGSTVDIANLLKPALARGELKSIGSTTYEEYRKHFEKDRALLRRFHRLDVFEPSVEDAKRILAGLAAHYEEHHGVVYTKEALDAAVDLTHRYVTDKFLPDKAIDIIDWAGATQKVADEDKRVLEITVSLIEDEVSKVAKIPSNSIKQDETSKLEHLDEDLRKAVYGQDKAISTLNDAVVMARAGLREPNKPMGAYLFTGPTGVGKTEAAKQLAASLDLHFLRYDMSEYMEKHSVSELIGAPPGYVGFSDGGAGSGKLVTDIETHPHCVLLLDEVEKAHPDIWNIFLQVFDNGRLTSKTGKVANFENVIIIMTSNAGAADMERNTIGFGNNSRDGDDDKALNAFFSPEFRNRLDAVVKFNKLSPDNMNLIVDKFIAQLNKLAAHKNVQVVLTDAARDWLADKGYDSKMGARPMNRLIQDSIKKPMSREMLFGKLKQGGTARVNANADGLVIEYDQAA